MSEISKKISHTQVIKRKNIFLGGLFAYFLKNRHFLGDTGVDDTGVDNNYICIILFLCDIYHSTLFLCYNVIVAQATH